jgi:predicted DNA-binding ribbon-helix-helix protein
MDIQVYTRGRSLIVKHSVIINGHKTSVSLEESFWEGLKEAAAFEGLTIGQACNKIESERHYANLSSAIRLFVLDFYKGQPAQKVAA